MNRFGVAGISWGRFGGVGAFGSSRVRGREGVRSLGLSALK